MEKLAELKKKLQCEKCHKPYRYDSSVYIHVGCNHHACQICYNAAPVQVCAVCKCSTTYTLIPFMADLLSTLKDYETLQNEYSVLKQQNLLSEVRCEDHKKCSECEQLYPDQEMQLCETCHELKFEDHEDVKNNALCSTCAIKKHIRKRHNTVDFFPYLSAFNFSSQTPKIKLNSEEFKSARNLLNDTFTRFNALSNNVSESKTLNVEADSELKERVTKLENNLKNIKKWYETRLGDCVDESEIVKLPTPRSF